MLKFLTLLLFVAVCSSASLQDKTEEGKLAFFRTVDLPAIPAKSRYKTVHYKGKHVIKKKKQCTVLVRAPLYVNWLHTTREVSIAHVIPPYSDVHPDCKIAVAIGRISGSGGDRSRRVGVCARVYSGAVGYTFIKMSLQSEIGEPLKYQLKVFV